jgi:hypothetical protein
MKVVFSPSHKDADEEDAGKEYVVDAASFEHTGGCNPGEAQQRVLERVCKLPVHLLQKLAEAMRMHPNTRQIRSYLASHNFKLPADDAQTICNLKLALVRYLKNGAMSKRPHEPSRRLKDAGAAPSKKQKPTFSSAFNFSIAVLEAAMEDKGFASAWDEAQ